MIMNQPSQYHNSNGSDITVQYLSIGSHAIYSSHGAILEL